MIVLSKTVLVLSPEKWSGQVMMLPVVVVVVVVTVAVVVMR